MYYRRHLRQGLCLIAGITGTLFIAAWIFQCLVFPRGEAPGANPASGSHHTASLSEKQFSIEKEPLDPAEEKENHHSARSQSPSVIPGAPFPSHGTAAVARAQVDAAAGPLDRIAITETIDESWPDGVPTADGWHRRVRIVKADFKSDWLRIEESVEVEIVGGTLNVKHAVIEKAMAARHVLISSQHASELAAQGISTESGRNPNYLRVLVDEPGLTTSIPALCDRLEKLGMGEIEPDAVVGACAQGSDPLVGGGLAWHLDNVGLLPGHRAGADIDARTAWDRRTDASSVLIALIDSGISSSDSELAASIRFMPGETLGDNADNDGNGYVDDALGYDFYHNDADPEDESGHGSMCAALIGAAGNNATGSSGVAWQASILNCKFLDLNGLGALSDAIDAIDYARLAKARILNMSWSYVGAAPLLREALARCDAEDILMVCASGNAGFAAPVPAPASIRLPHVVSVAASTPADTLASFSVVDATSVDLAAPGVDLPVALSSQTWNFPGDVKYATGTSFSAAIVSGSLALGLAEFPSDSSSKVLRRMRETVDPIAGGAAALSTGGRLNLGKMLGTGNLPVPHDAFAQRGILTDAAGQWIGRNDQAGVEEVDLNLSLSPAPQRSLWFEWTASAAGLLRVSARAADGTPVRLAVFGRAEGVPAALIARSPGGETLEIPVVEGKRLFWMIDSRVDIKQGLKLVWQLPPANDNWRDAPTVEGLPLTVPGNSLGATVENFEAAKPHQLWLPQGSVWWKWTPGATEYVEVTATADHVAFILPMNDGKPSFYADYQYEGLIVRSYQVEANRTYAILVIPSTPAAAGPFQVAMTARKDIAILVQPSDVAALEGESVVLGVQVAASDMPGYQWFKNGEAIPFAREPTLKLNPVTSQSFSTYHVVVTSAKNTLISDPAVVSPRNEPPRLVDLTPRRSVVNGQSIELEASFRSSSKISYSWLKNGQTITNATSSSYGIVSSTTADSGTYSLTATNAVGSTTAEIQVDVIASVWKGWVNRTPENKGAGRILSCALSGNTAEAFTACEWLRSTDGGSSWKSKPLPPNFTASTGAAHSNGSALVFGSMFSNDTYTYTQTFWQYSPSESWKRVTPVVISPGGARKKLSSLSEIHFFDGEWWSVTSLNEAIHSADGANWTPLADPSTPSSLLRATGMFRFEDRLAISYWPSGGGNKVLLRIPGGGTKVLEFGFDTSYVTRIGGACYTKNFQNRLKITDDSNWPVYTQPNGLDSALHSTEGNVEGELFHALEADSNNPSGGQLWWGIHEKTASGKAVGFSCFAKSGDRWLVGYPNGNLWSGTDLNDLPVLPGSLSGPHRDLTAYQNEFVYKGYHSSDGAKWQPLGAATSIDAKPRGGAGGNFLHSLQESFNLAPSNFISPSLYPSAIATNPPGMNGTISSGENSLLEVNSSSNGKSINYIRNQSTGLVIKKVNFGVTWDQINFVRQVGARWFVGGSLPGFDKYFLRTSTDGITWTASKLPPRCVVVKNGNAYLAIEHSTRGYTSKNGTAWTPVTLKGLPVVTIYNPTPTSIVTYRGYYVAQYGNDLYSSADGISWALSSAPLPIERLTATRQTLLAVSRSGEFLQPGGETAAGPSLSLPDSQYAISVPLHVGFKYDVQAEDADGDLATVSCYIDGKLASSLTTPPFVFEINQETQGPHAVEFVARDGVGRISRVTSKLTVLDAGIADGSEIVIDHDLSKAVLFKGDFYRIHEGTAVVWCGENRWKPVSSPDFKLIALVANAEALVASTNNGILTSQDGLNWTHFGGFDTLNQFVVPLEVRDGVIGLRDNSHTWVSRDGISWSLAERTDPPYSSPAQANISWVDTDFGLSNSSSYGNRVTYNGGRTWLLLPGNVDGYYSKNLSLKNGFLIVNRNGVYRFLRGETSFTQISAGLFSGASTYAANLNGLVFIGEPGRVLKSTTDGINFASHTPPPNLSEIDLRRFSGEWIASSGEMICASKDLITWRTIFDFRKVDPTLGDLPSYPITISQYGLESLLFKYDRLRSDGFVLNPDFSVTRISTAEPPWARPPDGYMGGLRFKNRIIALSSWYFTRPADGVNWEQSPLYPAEGYVPYTPETWPTTYSGSYEPTRIHAATASRFVMLRPSTSAPQDAVLTSDDGRTFTVSKWTGPIPLLEVTRIAASPDAFLAAATNGRVLLSSDGQQWTIHAVSASLNIGRILYFSGRWHVVGTNNTSAEIWSSTDGKTWARTGKFTLAGGLGSDDSKQAFVAGGAARINAGALGWLKSGDGLTWQIDTVLNAGMSKYGYNPQGAHPQGIFGVSTTSGTYSGDLVIVDAATGALIRKISVGRATLRWLDGWPFLYSTGRFTEWVETDPRLGSISADKGVFGVGDYLKIQLSAPDLADPSTPVMISLTADRKLGNGDDIPLAATTWNQGALQSDGSRRFTVALPPSITPGRFHVAARLLITPGTADKGIQNNQILTETPAVEIPGYELRLTTSGQGEVTASDPRVLYPQGARIQLEAVPENGFTFRGWTGSQVSAESVISVLMKGNKNLTVDFTPGHRVVVQAIGNGSVTGAQSTNILLPGESVQLSQAPGAGWIFSRWTINGTPSQGSTLPYQPAGDTQIEAVFIPDFNALRELAFAGASPEIDRSWTADPDGDGLTNWQEILLSTNPLVAQSLGEQVERQPDLLRFVFSRPQGPQESPWIQPEFSADLLNWKTPDSSLMTERVLSRENGTETIELTLPIQPSASGFFHLKMGNPPAQ